MAQNPDKKACKDIALNIKVHRLALQERTLGKTTTNNISDRQQFISDGTGWIMTEILNKCFTTNLGMSSVPQHHV